MELRWRRALARAAAFAAFVAAGAAGAAAAEEAGEWESPPLLRAPDVAPAELLQGPGWQVEDAAPSDGFLTRFTLRAEAGLFEAHGVESLAVRAAELAALREIARVRATEAWARAAAAVATRAFDPVIAGPRPAGDPVPGLASGVASWFGPDGAAASGADARVEGFEIERRKVAERLRVDPYTQNTVLAAALDDVAWAAWAGGLPRTSFAVPPGAGPAMPGSSVAHERVYEESRAGLRADNAARMRALGATDEQIAALAASPAVSLSAQAALVEALERLGDVAGRADVLALAATATTRAQALFLVRAAGILADRREQANVAALLARGTVVARRDDGSLLAVLPVDLLSWTDPLARFAQRDDLAAAERAVWITGRASSRAREALEALGWAVFEGVKP